MNSKMEGNHTSLIEFQEKVAEWTQYNFGDVPSWQPLLGVGEELGELQHAYLKREQGIRGTFDDHTYAMQDAIGDMLIYLLDFCRREGLRADDCLVMAWTQIRDRDWRRFPKDGRTE